MVEGIPGSGPGGRLTDKDVKAFLEAGGDPERPPTRPERAPLVEVAVAERIPLRGARRVIARRMLESLQSTAQLTSVLEIDVDAVVGWRNHSEPRIGYTTIFLALVAQALRRHPLLNSRIAGDEVEILADVNVGFAVNTDEGVIVPVVRGADTLALGELDERISELTEAGARRDAHAGRARRGHVHALEQRQRPRRHHDRDPEPATGGHPLARHGSASVRSPAMAPSSSGRPFRPASPTITASSTAFRRPTSSARSRSCARRCPPPFEHDG